MGIRWKDGYSAHVEIYLVVGGDRIEVGQVGPNWFVLQDHCEIPAETEGELVIVVDGHERRKHVFIHDGAIHPGQEVAYI